MDTATEKDEERDGGAESSTGNGGGVRRTRGRARVGKEYAGRTADYVNYEKLERRNQPTSFRRTSTSRARAPGT